MNINIILKKLGIKAGYKIIIINPPDDYKEQINTIPNEMTLNKKLSGKFNLIHVFLKKKSELDKNAAKFINVLKETGFLWISYPKKSSKIETDLSRDKG
ncbi:hypothetical protein ACFLS9_09275 [Bacteroidota bacterium]